MERGGLELKGKERKAEIPAFRSHHLQEPEVVMLVQLSVFALHQRRPYSIYLLQQKAIFNL
jgi:hypothetical protein